jgi:hypothetical protein
MHSSAKGKIVSHWMHQFSESKLHRNHSCLVQESNYDVNKKSEINCIETILSNTRNRPLKSHRNLIKHVHIRGSGVCACEPKSRSRTPTAKRMFTGLLVLDGACVADNILQMGKLNSALLIPIINKNKFIDTMWQQ